MSERISWIDIAKAIGIGFVVMGHLSNPEDINTFIYAFHMPLFFFLSGMTFRNDQQFSPYLQKKIRTIIIPYFLFAILTYIFWLLIGRHFGEDANIEVSLVKPLVGIFYSNGIDDWLLFNTPLWYLTCLFVVEMIFYFISRTNNKELQIFLLIMCGTVGYLLSLTNFLRLPWGINVGLTAIVIYGLGYFSKQIIHKMQVGKVLNFSLFILFFILCYFLSGVNGHVDMNVNVYGNIGYFYLGAILGILAIVNLSQFVSDNRILSFIGKNTLVILALHGVISSLIKGFMVFILNIELSILINNTLMNALFTLMTLIIAVPIIIFINRYIPELVGKKRIIDSAQYSVSAKP